MLIEPQPDIAKIMKANGRLQDVSLEDTGVASVFVDPEDAKISVEGCWCGHPDFPDEEIANSDPLTVLNELSLGSEDEAACLVKAHQGMMLGSGGWPIGCHPEGEGDHSFAYWTDDNDWSEIWTRPVTEKECGELVEANVWGVTNEQAMDLWKGKPLYIVCLELAERAYCRMSIRPFRVEKKSDCNIYVTNVPIAGSTIGLGWYPDGTCGDKVECRIDSTYRTDVHNAAVLVVHEMGHNNGLPHTFSGQSSHHGIMSYSPVDPFQGFREGPSGKYPTSIPQDPSIKQLRNQYGSEEIPYGGESSSWGFDQWHD